MMKPRARTSSTPERHAGAAGTPAPDAVLVFVGIGANLGDPRAALDAAQFALRALARKGSFRASSLYRTAPIDAAGPDFLNAVACFDTVLRPHALLAQLHAIEQRFGRLRPYRNAPRTLDLDLLLYGVDPAAAGEARGGLRLHDETLELPHPRAHLRAFVLEPLAELWPEGVVPGRGEVVALRDAVRAAGQQRIERVPPRDP
jgi:2-amino-4-hydroxy-6-hydroxymethyldihydropteridine diphosphokinase